MKPKPPEGIDESPERAEAHRNARIEGRGWSNVIPPMHRHPAEAIDESPEVAKLHQEARSKGRGWNPGI